MPRDSMSLTYSVCDVGVFVAKVMWTYRSIINNSCTIASNLQQSILPSVRAELFCLVVIKVDLKIHLKIIFNL